MRHDVGETVVVVSFDPYDFDVALGIREFADRAEKLPVFFLEASEVQVGKDVAKENETTEGSLLQHAGRIAGTTHLRAKMHVREDQRVIDLAVPCTNSGAVVLQGDERRVNSCARR